MACEDLFERRCDRVLRRYVRQVNRVAFDWLRIWMLVMLCSAGCARADGAAREDGPSAAPAAPRKQFVTTSPSEKVAGRGEALEACTRGCSNSVGAALGPEDSKRAYCDMNCTCIVGARFDAAGKQKPSTTEEAFMAQIEACRTATVEKVKWSPN